MHVSRKLKSTNQRINALEKRIADLEDIVKSNLRQISGAINDIEEQLYYIRRRLEIKDICKEIKPIPSVEPGKLSANTVSLINALTIENQELRLKLRDIKSNASKHNG